MYTYLNVFYINDFNVIFMLQTVVIPGEKASVTRLAASPNETHIAVGYADGNVKIFDVNTTENVCTFSGHKSAITALTFDQDGTRLASGSKVSMKIFYSLIDYDNTSRLKTKSLHFCEVMN
jgi:U3 small nucleolar RNA-associated protein 12